MMNSIGYVTFQDFIIEKQDMDAKFYGHNHWYQWLSRLKVYGAQGVSIDSDQLVAVERICLWRNYMYKDLEIWQT